MFRSIISSLRRLGTYISRSRLRFAIPPLVAVIAWIVWVFVSSIASGIPGPVPPFALLTLFLVILMLAIAGAATPFPLVAGVLSFHGRIQTMIVTVAASTPLVFALFITPHRWKGEAPLLADRLPLLGWLFDGVMDALPLTENTASYTLVFSAFTFLGFYLECVLVAAVFYALLRLAIFFHTNRKDGGVAE